MASPAAFRVLLASVLKPLDDTRMYEKFGRTLAQRPDWQVHVAGRQAPAPPEAPANLHTHALLAGSRLSWARVLAQARYWSLLRQLRPRLVIVHAPELLPLTLLWQWLQPRQRQFLYDVRENYALNISTQRVYSGFTQRWLAAGLRWIETLAARRAAGITLAEQSYTQELPFLPQVAAGRVVVLENKYQPAPGEARSAAARLRLPPPDEPLRLLYSGTISELNGVFEALSFTRQLRRFWPRAHLTIIGFCQQPAQLQRLQQAVAADDAATLIGGHGLVPHARIVAEIQRSHLGLLPYRPHASTWHCLPTKLYEYLAQGLPLLIPPNAVWQQALEKYGAGLVVNFEDAQALPTLARQLASHGFYPQGIPAEAFWQSEATKLWALLDTIR